MFKHQIFGLLAGLVGLVAFIPYLTGIFKGTVKPNRFSWMIWSLASFILSSSYLASGATYTKWVSLGGVVGTTLIALLALKWGQGGAGKIDKFCFFGALISVVLWWMTQKPEVALAINVVLDIVGAIPTIVSVWDMSAREDFTAWLLFAVANTLNMFAVDRWTFAIAGYPISLMLACWIVVILLLRQKRILSGISL